MKTAVWILLVFAASCYALDLSPVGAPTGGACIIMDKGYYAICYRADWRIPQWVGEHLTSEQFRVPQVKRTGGFRLDPDVAKADQSEIGERRVGKECRL